MNSSARRNQGSALVGIVLLLVALALAAGALYMLRTPEKASDSGAPAKVESAAAPANPRDKDLRPDVKIETGQVAGPTKAEKPIKFTVSVLGPVTGGASGPLANVNVVASPMKQVGIDKEHPVAAVTGKDGVASFSELPYSSYQVEASPAGLYPLSIRGAKDGEHIELVFGKVAPLSGKVTSSESSKPIAQVYVQVRSDMGSSAAVARLRQAVKEGKEIADIEGANRVFPFFRCSTETAEDGSFVFPGVPVGQNVTLNFEHDDYSDYSENFDVKDDSPITKDIVLLPRIEIMGRVIADESGEPVPGVKVQAGQNGMSIIALTMLAGGEGILESTSDANGNYSLKKLVRGRQCIFVHHPGFEDYTATFEVTTEDRYPHEIRLLRAAGITGLVVDSANTPVEGVSLFWIYPEAVILGNQATQGEPAARTTADGAFALRGLPVNRPIHLIAVHPDYVTSKQENLVLNAGEELAGVQIMMSRGGSISGAVIDTLRQPLVGASITARPIKPPGPALASVTTGADGTYVVNNTPPGNYEVTCEAPGYCIAINGAVRDVATGVQFTMVKEGIYSGRLLVDQSGDPIAKFRIRMRASDPNGPTRDIRSETVRDRDGKFEVKGLAPGMWDFEFTSEGLAPLVVSRVNITEGETLKDQDVHIKVGAACVGVVKSTSGKPIAGALVRMDHLEAFAGTDKTYTKLQTSTNANGEFEIKNLIAGKYRIWATHPMFAPSGERDVAVEDAPQTRVDFDLPKPASLKLVVRDDKGNTLPGATATLFQGNSPLDTAQKRTMNNLVGISLPDTSAERTGIGSMTDAGSRKGMNAQVGTSGELSWRRKEPGNWTIWVQAPNFYKYSAKIKLEAGKETVHEAVLSPMEPGAAPRGSNLGAKPTAEERELKNPKMKERKDELAQLTAEEREVMKLKKEGQQLTEEQQKLLKQARKKMNETGATDDATADSAPAGEGEKAGKHKKGDKKGHKGKKKKGDDGADPDNGGGG